MPGDRTEKPTPRKQKRAREQGRVARSRDLSASLAFGIGILCLGWGAGQFPAAWRSLLERVLGEASAADLGSTPLLAMNARLLAVSVLPVLACAWATAAIASLAQGGLVIAPAALSLHFSRFNPATRVQQLFSLPALSRALRSIIPVAVVCYLAVTICMRDLSLDLKAVHLNVRGLAWLIFGRAFELTWKSALVLLGWAVADYLLERRHLQNELYMSRQELIDDYKETEGNPLIKARIRRLRRQTLRRKMLEDTKRATVVITNPSEFAVALEYKPAMSAPMVVAKGRNLLAQQIKQVARWHGIPMVENRPLAHALYRAAEIGQYIPPKLYSAVAAILAAVYRAERRAAMAAAK